MLNVTAISGNNQHAAAHYFSASDDYYAKEEAGQWQGKGAETLGLSGAVDQTQFARLLNGQLPDGRAIDTTFDKTKNMKRMGLDLTFSAPKSVSMQALVGGDRSVTDAHDKAVAKAIEQVERLAQTRKKVKGKSTRERTGNMVVGKFRHEMSRAKDPQLHTHAVIVNMTQRSDGKWRALANEDIFQTYHEVDAIYKTELAKELQALGYAIRVVDDKGNFELDHISRDQIEAFSERSKVIEEALANEGKTRATSSTAEKQVIALATRQRKQKGDIEIVKKYWLEKSKEFGIDYTSKDGVSVKSYQQTATPFPSGAKNPVITAQGVVEYAIKHLAEREAVVTESALIATAAQRAVGIASHSQIKQELKRLVEQGTLIAAAPVYKMAESKDSAGFTAATWQEKLMSQHQMSADAAKDYVTKAIKAGSLVEAEKRYTTQTALKREQAILAIEKDGRKKVNPIMAVEQVNVALKRSKLSQEQRSVVETIVSTPNRFVGVQGDAGTGKTYAVNKARELVELANSQIKDKNDHYRIVALAPYGNQVKALKNEGMEAHTLASFIHTKNKPIDGKTLIILDESGVVGARQLAQLMRIVETANARMVMLGDTKQTEAIEAGKPFAQLQRNGMQTARLKAIQRQREPRLKLAVEHAAAHKVEKSLSHIGHIEEIAGAGERHKAIVADYMQLPEAERKDSLIISGTNQARREINNLVRGELNLAGKGREFDTLTRVDMTQEQRRYAPSYRKGMVIQPEKDYPKAELARGDTYIVKEALPGNLLALEKPDKTTIIINPRKITSISVYHLEKTELSVGDTVRVNRNDPQRDLTNGDRMKVASVTGGIVRLEPIDEKHHKPLPALSLSGNKPLHLEYGYASTVHGSQGLTSNKVYVSLDTKSRTTSMNLYYVAISRARHEARIYTDSLKELPSAISRRYNKTSALELQTERKAAYQAKRGVAAGKAGVTEGRDQKYPDDKRQQYQYGGED